MFLKFSRRRTADVNYVFNAQYIDPKGLFVSAFGELPSVVYITEVDVNRAYPHLKKTLQGQIDAMYQHAHYNYDTGKPEFNVTLFVLRNNMLVETGSDYVGIYYGRQGFGAATQLLKQVADFRISKPSNKIGFATQKEAQHN